MRSENTIGNFLLGPGSIFALIILVLGLKDVFSNENIKMNEKMMWLTGFIFILPIAGILYFPTFRQRNGKLIPPPYRENRFKV
jgi:hypothetical protein